MAHPRETGNMGGLEHYRRGDIGTFRTVTDGPAPVRTRVRSLPTTPPRHFYDGVKDANIVHLIGTDPVDQATAISYATYPSVAERKFVWTADLTGQRTTDDLTHHAIKQGVGTLHWRNISPTRLVDAQRSGPDEEKYTRAAKLVVDSMPPTEREDTELTTTRIIHLTRVLETLAEKEPETPLLGGAYNGISEILNAERKEPKFPITVQTENKMRGLFKGENSVKTAQEVLGPIHIHMEALLRGDNLSQPVRFNDGEEATFFNYGVTEGLFLPAKRRLLAAHIDLLSSEEQTWDQERNEPKPDEVVISGVEHSDAQTLEHTQMQNLARGARTLFVFGGVNDTTKAMVGSDRAVTGSLGGLNGPDAEVIADSIGKHWQRAVTSRSTHSGGSNSVRGKDGATVTDSADETTTYEARHTVSTDALMHVAPESVTLVQGKIAHKDVPFRARTTTQTAQATIVRERPPVRALPERPQRSKFRVLGWGRNSDKKE